MGLKIKSIFASIILLSITACGSSKDTVTITVNTAIPVKAPASVDLSQSLMSLMSVTPGVDCYQDQIYLVVRDPASQQFIQTKRVKLRSTLNQNPSTPLYDNSAGSVDTIKNRITSNSYFDEPLTITIPKNIPVEIGIVGSFFNPIDDHDLQGVAGHDGLCDQAYLLSSITYAYSSTTLIGHTTVDSNVINSGLINLNIDLLHTNPIAAYGFAGSNPRYKDWINLPTKFLSNYTSGAGANVTTNGYLESVHYLNNQINVMVQSTGITDSNIYLPHIFPMTLIFKYNATGDACPAVDSGIPCGHYSYTINSNDAFNNNQITTITANLMVGTPFSYTIAAQSMQPIITPVSYYIFSH